MSRSGESITEELEGVLMQCLEKDPANRLPSMRALSEALMPFEITQTFATVDDGDLIHIEDTGETAVVKGPDREPIELELAELELLALRFGKLSTAVKKRVQGANEEALFRWTPRVLTARTLAEVLDGDKGAAPKARAATRARKARLR